MQEAGTKRLIDLFAEDATEVKSEFGREVVG